MTFREWQQLSPDRAAREVHERVRTRLAPAQQAAAIAHLAPLNELTARFTVAAGSGPLGAVPFFAKDLFDAAGIPTKAGSTFLPEVRATPANHGAFVHALVETGAVLAGKTHMHEFAYGITGENPHYGDCEHPHFPGRTTGGSSSGSAAVVAAGVAPLALGSDTGGSVRLPAAFCGIYGFRLSPRDRWISDAVPLAPSFDTAGWFTATAPDMQTALDALVVTHTGNREPRGCFLEIGTLDHDVAQAFRAAAARFTEPAEPAVRDMLLHGFAPAVDAYNTTVALEAWEVHCTWADRYRERYSPGVWQRLNRAQAVTPAQSEAADLAVVSIRTLWERFFATYDFLILPASPTPALTKAECTLESRNRILTLTAPASLGGRPVLTIPVPLPSGLSTGLQIVVPDAQSPVVRWALQQCG